MMSHTDIIVRFLFCRPSIYPFFDIIQRGNRIISMQYMSTYTKHHVESCIRTKFRRVHVESRLQTLGLSLPAPAIPKGNFVNYVKCSKTNLVYLSGHLPVTSAGNLLTGRVGENVTQEAAYDAAKICGLNICATIKHNLGDLDKVNRIVKLNVFVNCIDGFTQQPGVANGCSDLMVELFGEKGKHARAAVGVNTLPLGVPVEVEAVIEIDE